MSTTQPDLLDEQALEAAVQAALLCRSADVLSARTTVTAAVRAYLACARPEASPPLDGEGAALAALPWRCFHCDEVFTDHAEACAHFGNSELCQPICCMSVADVREMEHQLERYRCEDSDKDREFYAMRADHARALIKAEQEGYDKGLNDGRADRAVAAPSVPVVERV